MSCTPGLSYVTGATGECSLHSSARVRVNPVLLTPPLPQAVEGGIPKPSDIKRSAPAELPITSGSSGTSRYRTSSLVISRAYNLDLLENPRSDLIESRTSFWSRSGGYTRLLCDHVVPTDLACDHACGAPKVPNIPKNREIM